MPSILDLPWLPPAPADLRAQCAALPEQAGREPVGERVRFLAAHRLRQSEAALLGKAIRRVREADPAALRPLSPFKLAVAASGTFDIVGEALPAAAARHGVALELVAAPFDQVAQEAFDAGSATNRSGADAVLVAVDHRWLKLGHDLGGDGGGDPAARLAAATDLLAGVVAAFRENGLATIVQTVPVPPAPLFGSFDRRAPGSQRALIEAFNAGLADLAAETGSTLLDVAALAGQIGTDAWFDPVQWNLYKLPFSAACNAAYADGVGRLLGSLRGKARKCLVLDLDNTVWGGVIGDDGLEGIKVGEGSAEGEGFLAVQRLALDLKGRGIVLAASSKNDDEVARGPFRHHPDMLLREGDLAAFQANWLDKPSNLEAIAASLNLGLDALVFLDDNAAERAQVRAALPAVAVPELPADAAWYPWFLANAGYFEAVSFSGEDRLRAQSYAADARRTEVRAKARDLGDYLRSLDIEIAFAPFDPVGRSRTAQLINKSNQFNLTTRRRTEAEVAALEGRAGAVTLQVRLRDKFSDFGMIGVAVGFVAERGPERVLDLDTWLMSCRVLGRRVEEAMLGEIVREAMRLGAAVLVGRYVPTERNGMVAEHYPKLGFTETGREPDGARSFELRVADYVTPELPARIVRTEGDAPSGAPSGMEARAAAARAGAEAAI